MKAIERHIQNQIILAFALLMIFGMWYDLMKKVESGKPFQVNDKTYKAVVISYGEPKH